MTDENSGRAPAQDSTSTEWDTSVTYQTVASGLYERPDSDYFEVTWEMPEPSVGVILRRGEEWRPALLKAIREEFAWWIEALEHSGLEDNEVRFGVLVPAPLPGGESSDGPPALRLV